MQSFWDKLEKPFFVMAPMADVTDPAFRALVAKHGKPAVTWTEFVSADGLYYTREVKKIPDAENPLMRDLQFTEAERPIVAQIFSSKPEMIAYAAKLVAELGFDGVDLNMGCPDKSIEKQGAGACLIKHPKQAVELIAAAKAGAARALDHSVPRLTITSVTAKNIQNSSYRTNFGYEKIAIPVSVKTRVGYNKENLDEWIPAILSAEPAALTVHLRTRKEMSLVPAHWDYMQRVVALRDAHVHSGGSKALIIGNGDVEDIEKGLARIAEMGCDGIMIGRGIFGNPWVFSGRAAGDTPLPEKLAALIELAEGFEKLRPTKNFYILKKHIKAFVTGFDGAAEFRAKLMGAENARELAELVRTYASG